MVREDLIQFYHDKGLTSDQFWLGPEHPALENLAIEVLSKKKSKKVLEIGYQAGGFAIPLILQFKDDDDFRYTGVDSLAYANSVNGATITQYLLSQHVGETKYDFVIQDAQRFLNAQSQKYDLILIDHLKKLYPRALKSIIKKNLLADKGTIFLHDVLKRAEKAWMRCASICKLNHLTYEILSDIPAGLAVVEKGEVKKLTIVEKIIAHLKSI
ncbi:MAG: hypothetical protein JW795_05135 [Chitinivibrionales bacterium]|nr:hypothetical protein [Chitinivibrionales bacterium]